MKATTSKAKSIFIELVDKVPRDQWSQHLDKACGNHYELRQEIVSLLDAHADDNFLAVPAIAPTATESFASQLLDTDVGPYRLREQIGEGGMGIVYVAEQSEPVRRKVALKIIKPGMASKSVVARFEAERQALALMDHPNVATVHDGGATEDGRPYFVMELVQGLPITDYCDQQRMDIRQRLQLFCKVCEAVEHAHRKGIIHRDLKPSNVLVPEFDGRPVPKVIDFGISKALGEKLSDATVYTHFSQLVGTPAYMSPEQAGMGVIDVDTRSDVYSLGVLMYELLTGRTPFDRNTLRQAGYDEIRRVIREVEPARPSKRVSTLDAEAFSTLAHARRSDARKLRLTLRGELDWLVAKALEKDRDRRYESPNALAEDVRRFLSNRPIFARPPSSAYRIRKFVQRNKARLLPAALAAGVLVVGMTLSLSAVFQERAEKQRLLHETAQRLYASRMMQATGAWEDGDYGTLRELLQSSTPQTSDVTDFRGWEWHFLDNQLRKPFVAIPSKFVVRSAWHPQDTEMAVVVSASEDDAAIEIWKPGNKTPIRTIAVLENIAASTINGFTWAPNGQRMAVTTNVGRALVLDAKTGLTVFDRQVHDGTGDQVKVPAVDFSPTGKVLATASLFGQIKTWDIENQRLMRVIWPGEDDHLTCVAFSPDGTYLAAARRFGRRTAWNLENTDERLEFRRVGLGAFGRLEWSGDGKRLATTDSHHKVAVYRWDDEQAFDRKPLLVFPHTDVHDVCWLDDEGLASCGADQTIKIWNLSAGRIIRSLRVGRAHLSRVSVSSDGQFLASRGPQGLSLIRLDNQFGYEMIHSGDVRSAAESVRWSHDGQRLAVKFRTDPEHDASQDTTTSIRIYNTRTWQLVSAFDDVGHGHVPMLCWSAHDNRLFDVDNYGHRFIFDTSRATKTEDDAIHHAVGDGFEQVVLNEQMGLVAIATDTEVRICEHGDLQTVDALALAGDIWSVRLAWSPDNRSLLIAYVVDGDIHIRTYEVQSQKAESLPPILGADNPVVTWNPTSKKIAIGSQNAEIHVQNVLSREQRRTLVGHTAPIQEVSWSPDGSRIASCANDGTLRVWDAVHGDQLAVFSFPENPQLLNSVQWSPNGQRLAVSGSRGEIYVLNSGPTASKWSHAKTPSVGRFRKNRAT
jgi:serine/threonine protein kinase/dipeptidyl aminopeptidase/acylaminoacyl peptidase